jgi:hypothetical protein
VNTDILPDAADTRSLGSVDKEWRNLYLGNAGKIYLGLAQDVDIYRSAADVLKTDDNLDALALRIGGIEVISSTRVLKSVTGDGTVLSSLNADLLDGLHASSFTLDQVTAYGNVANRDVYFQRWGPKYTTWSPIGDGGAAIINDNVGYKALMIVGSDQGQGYGRLVRLWDFLGIEGSMYATGYGNLGSLRIGGIEVLTSARVLYNIASISQTLSPTSDNSYDLGSTTLRWKNGYFSAGIDVGDIRLKNGITITEDGEETVLKVKGRAILTIEPDGGLVIGA